MPRLAPIAALLALTALVACPKSSEGDGTTPPPGDDPTVPAGVVDPGQVPADDGGEAPGGCLSDADCGEGSVCEGLGCTDDEPGTCSAPGRMCTRDSRPYCGCDGQTFRSSGSCPGRRYASEGPCEGDPAMPGPEPGE